MGCASSSLNSAHMLGGAVAPASAVVNKLLLLDGFTLCFQDKQLSPQGFKANSD